MRTVYYAPNCLLLLREAGVRAYYLQICLQKGFTRADFRTILETMLCEIDTERLTLVCTTTSSALTRFLSLFGFKLSNQQLRRPPGVMQYYPLHCRFVLIQNQKAVVVNKEEDANAMAMFNASGKFLSVVMLEQQV